MAKTLDIMNHIGYRLAPSETGGGAMRKLPQSVTARDGAIRFAPRPARAHGTGRLPDRPSSGTSARCEDRMKWAFALWSRRGRNALAVSPKITSPRWRGVISRDGKRALLRARTRFPADLAQGRAGLARRPPRPFANVLHVRSRRRPAGAAPVARFRVVSSGVTRPCQRARRRACDLTSAASGSRRRGGRTGR